MRVSWTSTARAERRHAVAYLYEQDPDAAAALDQQILRSAATLGQYPHIGRTGKLSGTFEYVVPRSRYVLIYRLHQARIEIMRLKHTAQR